MQNNEMTAGTNAEQSKNVDDTSVSQTIAKPNVGGSVNQEYADLVYSQYELNAKKQKSIQEENKLKSNADKLTKMELGMSSEQIIKSIRYAFKHIPPRN